MAERAHCMFCHDELWSHLERSGVCCSCQGLPLDDGGEFTPEDEAAFAEADVHFEAFYDATTEGPLPHKSKSQGGSDG